MKSVTKALTIVALSVATSTFGQKIASTAVPAAVMTKFQKDFPSVKDAEWKMDGVNYHVDFEIARKDVDVWYSPQAKFIKKESELVQEYLPKEVIAVIDSNYKDYKTDDVKKFVVGSTVTYVVELEATGKDLKVTFDKTGKVLNSVPK